MAASNGVHRRVSSRLSNSGHGAMLPVSMDRPQGVRLLRQLVDLLMVVVAKHYVKLLREAIQEMDGEEFRCLFAGGTQLEHVGEQF